MEKIRRDLDAELEVLHKSREEILGRESDPCMRYWVGSQILVGDTR